MRVLLSWSSGKDSAWALHRLRARPDLEVAGLLTTFAEASAEASDEAPTSAYVPVHGVPLALVRAQADALGLPLQAVGLPWPSPNAAYEARVGEALVRARGLGVTHVAFGDLLLEEVRAYREGLVASAGLEALFPLWDPPGGTLALAREMIGGGLRALVTAVDAEALGPSFAGRPFDQAFLRALPPGCDPCGENGEFHTFCHGGPPFRRPLRVEASAPVLRAGLWQAALAEDPTQPSEA